MNTTLKILLAALLITAVFTREKICEHLGFGQAALAGHNVAVKDRLGSFANGDAPIVNYFINDSLYRWNEQLLNWMPFKVVSGYQAELVTYHQPKYPAAEPIELTWQELINISYRLRYFSELDMEIYSPVFPKTIKALDGKEIIIEGFIIPFDEEEELLSLSANPYASCFFCGMASPASVMSMYLKDNRKRYKMDDFKKFRGTLHLNYDDPTEFYYILRNATEE